MLLTASVLVAGLCCSFTFAQEETAALNGQITDRDGFVIAGDRVQLQQVLMNLMTNGIDAMKGLDGTRELTIQSQRGEDDQVLISVSDTGGGLPAQQSD
jgi:C4-dicarboxylate-specific signal transduction histidine kinase